MSEKRNIILTKWACYTASMSMSVTTNLAPILFLTFQELYDISYTLLGLLVLINFSTQLLVDLAFSFLSHKINAKAAVKVTPILNITGFLLFAAAPLIFPGYEYIGLLIGTVIYSASSGFNEVLISPVIAALPSDNADREVSKLHSLYAWGVVIVVPVCTLFLLFIGGEMWQLLPLVFSVIPLISAILFMCARLPDINSNERTSGTAKHFKNPLLWVMVIGIFLGGASECTISQWASSYIEGALGVPKVFGDIFGVALFAAMLALGRTLFARFGRRAEPVIFGGAILAFVCYVVAAISPIPVIGLIATALCGLATSMLWPGSLIISSSRIPTGGVFIYALMAAGGDLGASVGPQMVGAITDIISANTALTEKIGIGAEELGMRSGMLIGAAFPLIAIFIYLYLLKTSRPRAAELEKI